MLRKIVFISLALMGALWVTNVSAQRYNGNMNMNNGQRSFNAIPNLTEEQQQKINALAVPHQKAMMVFNNQIAEKEAKLISLTTGDNADVVAAKSLMKEIAAVKLQMAEARLDHQMEVRKLLNDEQRLWFDQRHAGNGMGYGHHGNGNGMHRGNGQGMGNGMGRGMHDGSGPHGTGHRNYNPDCPNNKD